jgi:hypothetical protein
MRAEETVRNRALALRKKQDTLGGVQKQGDEIFQEVI